MYRTVSVATLPVMIDPEIMSGVPVFAGTRVPVQTLFDYLIDGCALAEFLDNFPTVSREAALKLLEYAAGQIVNEAVPA